MQRSRIILAGAVLLTVGVAGVLLGRDGPNPIHVESLKNPGFESGTDDWSIAIYGAKPTIGPDGKIVHEGKQSLRISSTEPSDAALSQELMLAPGRPYRLCGWVRTRDLDPHGAPVYGTFQIQTPGGREVVASGTNHGGDTDWNEVVIDFEAPPGGRTRVAVFFTGFGKGTGTAWFDDLKIEEVDAAKAPLRITRDFLPGTINPMQYGQFIEYLCDLVPSMWAEKLYDGGFEGLSPYKVVYLKETDYREKPWRPYGATNRAEFTLDRDNPVSGQTAQRIAAKDGAPCTVGIAQDGIAVQKGMACDFSCYLRQQNLDGPVTVRLHRDGTELTSCTFEPGGEWKKFHARLDPTETETNATLSITFRGPGTLWIDNASLMPEDGVGGWRRDVVEAVRALKPSVIRFGGSTLDDANLGEFEWKDTIGDPDKRKPFRAWGGLQPTGPGLEEIVQFCRLVDAEPLICVRFSKRKPEDAAEEVQYFNGAADTPMGKLRAKNGHPEPYHIKFWQVGNERSGADYEARLAAFCKGMREADPTITLLSSYPTEGVLKAAADQLAYVCPHQYNCANLAACERELDATRQLIRQFGRGRPIKVAVTEWNTTGGDWGPGRAKLWTLENALACSRYHNLLHRQADIVDIADRSNLVNSFCSGIIQTDNHRLYKTPTYYAQQLYAAYAGSRPLKIESAVPVRIAPDVSATLSQDGSVVTLFAVNATLNEVARPLDFSAFGDKGQEIAVWTLADRQKAGEPDVTNGFGDPERVSPAASMFGTDGPRFTYRFPPLSLTVLRWKVAS
ncbi:MAG TPA: alpha-L-arabinofuranosidase C-terminal domain-containing protein [Gemmataceae bacterium]|nr:alpha-L-arabinofuranosidase C-terminal domain-containing protein [Gemmataceae bacterium]